MSVCILMKFLFIPVASLAQAEEAPFGITSGQYAVRASSKSDTVIPGVGFLDIYKAAIPSITLKQESNL